MTENQLDFILVKEPGSTVLAEEIRNILLHEKEEIDKKTELFLFMAARNDLIKKIILPALNDQQHVISDRSFISSCVYQSNNDDLSDIYWTHKRFMSAIPDHIFFLDIDPKKALERKQENEINRFEEKGLDFHYDVYEKYKKLAENKIIYSINAEDRTPFLIAEQIYNLSFT